MQLARIIGRATASLKHPSLRGCKMMIVQVLDAQGGYEPADPLMAIDLVGAGVGDTVMLTSDGPTSRDAVGDTTAPIRWSIIGVQNA
jgi:ethanolamine utilization protein EutN